MLAGEVVTSPQTRYSPAGLPLCRFLLEHRSMQVEAGYPREARCRVQVVASGADLAASAEALAPGSAVRVEGFLARADYRDGEARLVVRAQRIESTQT